MCGGPNFFWPSSCQPPGLADPTDSPVAAVSPKPWQISIFWPTKDASLWSAAFDGTQPDAPWPPPVRVTDAGVSWLPPGIVAVSSSPEDMQIFWAGPDLRVRSTYFDRAERRWVQWFPLGRPWPSVRPVVVSGEEGEMNVLTATGDKMIRHTRLAPSQVKTTAFFGQAQQLIVMSQELWHRPEPERSWAVARALEAVTIMRTLPEHAPTPGEWIMWPVTPYLETVGRKDEAIQLAAEAVEIFGRLSEGDPVKYGERHEAAKKLLERLRG